MPDVNDEMKAIADYAIKSAKERFKIDLDYSEASIVSLDNILEKIYWGFSNRTSDGGEGGLIYNTAIIWGSYLGEYMRQKWGGTWLLKGSDRILSILNIEFSPVNLVYQKITSRPNYSVDDYLNEAKRVIYRSSVNPQEAKYQPKKTERFKTQIEVQETKKPFTLNKRVLIPLGGAIGALLILVTVVIVYANMRPGGLGLIGDATKVKTEDPTLVSTTNSLSSTYTQAFTATTLPTNTPEPTVTPKPSVTPSPTYTQSPTFTPTDTEVPTGTPTLTPTEVYVPPTRTRTPTRTEPEPTDTEIPQPTATDTPPPPPPPVLEWCAVNPYSVPAGQPVSLTFSVKFSETGYGFSASLSFDYPLASACDGNADANGLAECTGSSGMLPSSTTVDVTFSTPLGNCTASYSSP